MKIHYICFCLRKVFEKIFIFLFSRISICLRRIKLFWFGCEYGKNVRIIGPFRIRKTLNGKIIIGNNFTCIAGYVTTIDTPQKSMLSVEGSGILRIGDNVGMTSTSIYCMENVEIGKHVMIGADCLIIDTNFHSVNYKLRGSSKEGWQYSGTIKTSPVKICDHVFIGARSIVCKGVTIGKGSMISAGSVVVKDVPEWELWGGNPACFLKKISK